MNVTQRNCTLIPIVTVMVILACELLTARTAHATEPVPIDETAWGIYTKLAGTYKLGNEGGYLMHWEWKVIGAELLEQWLDPGTKRVKYSNSITLGAEPGQLHLSGLMGMIWKGTHQPDGSVLYVRDGVLKAPYRASLEPDGAYEIRRVKMQGDQVVLVKPASKYERFMPVAPPDSGAAQLAQASQPAADATPSNATSTAAAQAAPVGASRAPGVAASAFGLKLADAPEGISVLDIVAGSPAQSAGMTAGMVITHVNGLPIKGIPVTSIAGMMEPLDAMKLTVMGGETIDLSRAPPLSAEPVLRGVPETWGVLYQMAGSKWLIATDAGQMLATEAFLLEWSEAVPAYTSVLRLRGETSGAQLFSFQLDSSHRYVVTHARTGESPAYVADATGELSPASATETHRMRRVSATQVTTEKQDAATGLWKGVYNYFQVGVPVASTMAVPASAPATTAAPSATYDPAPAVSAYVAAQATPEIPRGDYDSHSSSYSSYEPTASTYGVAQADPPIPRDSDYDGYDGRSSSGGNFMAAFQSAFSEAMGASDARDAHAAAMIQEAVRQGEAIRELEEQRRRREMEAAQERDRELVARQQAQFEAQQQAQREAQEYARRQREEAERQAEQSRLAQQRLDAMRASNSEIARAQGPAPGDTRQADSRSSSPSKCRLVDDYAKLAIGEGPSENEALAVAMAKTKGCEAKTEFCDKRREILKVNQGGTYTTTDWIWECRVSYQCGEQRQVCDPPAGPVGASKQ